MKKLNSLLAAGALLLGLTGCSGDLHDFEIDMTTLQLKGSAFTWDSGQDDYKFKKDTDGTYYYEFIATDSSVTFAIDDTGPDGKDAWKTTYRGTADDRLVDDFKESFGESKTVSLYPHDDGDCMKLALDAGATYRIIVEAGSGCLECTVKRIKDAVPFTLIDENGESMAMTSTGANSYEYNFTPEEDGNMKFYVQSTIVCFAPYYDEDLELGKEIDLEGEVKAEADCYWTMPYTKGVPYKITVTSDDSGAYTLTGNYGFLIGDDILSGSQFSDNKLTWTFTSEYASASVEFTYDESKNLWGSPEPWAIHNDGWSHKYCGGVKLAFGDDFVELPADGENAEFTGLESGTAYVLTIKADAEKVYAKVEAK